MAALRVTSESPATKGSGKAPVRMGLRVTASMVIVGMEIMLEVEGRSLDWVVICVVVRDVGEARVSRCIRLGLMGLLLENGSKPCFERLSYTPVRMHSTGQDLTIAWKAEE